MVLGRALTEVPAFAQKTKAVAPLRFWWISRRTIPRCYQHHLSAEARCNCGSHQPVVPPVTTCCRSPRPSVYLLLTSTQLSAVTYKRQVTVLTSWQNCREVHGVVVNFPEWFYRAACRIALDLTSERGFSLHPAAYSTFRSPIALCQAVHGKYCLNGSLSFSSDFAPSEFWLSPESKSTVKGWICQTSEMFRKLWEIQGPPANRAIWQRRFSIFSVSG